MIRYELTNIKGSDQVTLYSLEAVLLESCERRRLGIPTTILKYRSDRLVGVWEFHELHANDVSQLKRMIERE